MLIERSLDSPPNRKFSESKQSMTFLSASLRMNKKQHLSQKSSSWEVSAESFLIWLQFCIDDVGLIEDKKPIDLGKIKK